MADKQISSQNKEVKAEPAKAKVAPVEDQLVSYLQLIVSYRARKIKCLRKNWSSLSSAFPIEIQPSEITL